MTDSYDGYGGTHPVWNSVVRAARRLISRLPRRLKGILYEYCLDDSTDTDRLLRVLERMLPRLNIVEISATGSFGIVTSLAQDNSVLTEYIRSGTFSSQTVQEIAKFFAPKGGVFIDIGANIGLTTLPIARNPNVRCLAFEPEPVNFRLLQHNIERNGYERTVATHQVALFDRHDTLKLAKAGSNIGDHRVNLGASTTREMVDVNAVPLDDFYDQIDGPLVVKIDTQGAEPYVIAGGRKVLERADILAIEFTPFLIRQMGGDIKIVIELISSFSSVAVMTPGNVKIPRYLPPNEALLLLRQKANAASNLAGDYFDILARRNPPRT